MEILFTVIVLAFMGLVFLAILTKKGKGLFFGGELVQTVGDKVGGRRGIVNANVKVHVIKTKLPPPNTYQIGLELGQPTFTSTRTAPITLSKREARRLIEMLKEAIEYDNSA